MGPAAKGEREAAMTPDDEDLPDRGQRVVQRRRLLAVAGAVAATIGIAGAVAVLGPRGGDDARPALPAPTASTTPSPTASATPSPSGAPSSEPPASVAPIRTAPPTASSTPTPSPSSIAGDDWSEPVTVAGSTYRARFVARPGERNHDVVMQRDGITVFAPDSVFNTEGRWGVDQADRRLVYYLGGVRVTDLLTIGGRPVEDEVVGHVALPTPDGVDVAGEPYLDLHITIVRTTSTNPEGITGWVVQVEDGGVWDLSEQ